MTGTQQRTDALIRDRVIRTHANLKRFITCFKDLDAYRRTLAGMSLGTEPTQWALDRAMVHAGICMMRDGLA